MKTAKNKPKGNIHSFEPLICGRGEFNDHTALDIMFKAAFL